MTEEAVFRLLVNCLNGHNSGSGPGRSQELPHVWQRPTYVAVSAASAGASVSSCIGNGAAWTWTDRWDSVTGGCAHCAARLALSVWSIHVNGVNLLHFALWAMKAISNVQYLHELGFFEELIELKRWLHGTEIAWIGECTTKTEFFEQVFVCFFSVAC